MGREGRARALRALDHTQLLDGTPLGAPEAAEGNPLLEETGFERLVTFDANGPSTELDHENATQEGASEASSEVARHATEPSAAHLPRALARAVATLVTNDRRRSPEEGDQPTYEIDQAENVAPSEAAVVLDVEVEPGDELYVASAGTDATDAQDVVEITVDGLVAYRKPFSPMTISEARTARCFDPPHRARKRVTLKITNNGSAPATFTANLRGWTRRLTRGTLGDRAPNALEDEA